MTPGEEAPPSPVPSARLALAILALGIVAGLSLRVTGMARKRSLAHDEGITYLAATGHQGEYASIVNDQSPPYAVWAPARAWKRLLHPEKAFCFGQIAADLGDHDIHPPLYFWILHLVVLALDARLWSGPLLNLLVDLLGAFALYRFARRVLADRTESATVVLIWLVSPAVVGCSLAARQYSLLALFSVLLADRTFACLGGRAGAPSWTWPALAATSLAGALTHYHFFIPAGACCLLLAGAWWRGPRRALMQGLAAIATGYLLSFAVHPGFYRSFVRQQALRQPFDSAELVPRVKTVISSLVGFVCQSAPLMKLFAALGGGLLLFVVARAFLGRIRARSSSWGPWRAWPPEIAAFAFLCAWIPGSLVLLYLLFLSPAHGMGDEKMSMAWPLLAFLPVLLTRSLLGARRIVRVVVCLVVLLGGVAKGAGADAGARGPDAAPALRGARAIVLDNPSRGVLPRVVWHVPDERPVFAAAQEDLLLKPEAWSHGLAPGGVYVGFVAYSTTREGQRRIVAVLERTLRLRHLEADLEGPVDLYLVEGTPPASASDALLPGRPDAR